MACRPHGGRGLSPRLRGNLAVGPGGVPAVRSIPAPAGEPPELERAWLISWVYPRACGGTIPFWQPDNQADGLSPWLIVNTGVKHARTVVVKLTGRFSQSSPDNPSGRSKTLPLRRVV